MSSIVKNNRVIVNNETRVLLRSQALFQVNTQQNHVNYPEMAKRENQQAKDIILDAQKKAKQIKLEAQEEIARASEAAREEGHAKGYSEGYNEGFEQGLKEGQTQGRAKYEGLIKDAEQLKQQYLEDHKKLYKVSEENMLMLAIDIAQKIIGDALENDPKAYMELAYKALKLVKGQKKVQLRVSSEDFPEVMGNKDLLISRLEGIEDIHIVEDAFLDRGSCIIHTGNGIIDGSVETQMDEIESTLIGIASSIL